jgi:YhcH/YjgK/YiaL family protein
MIIDTIENAHLYRGLSDRLGRGLDLISDPSLAAKPDGKYEIDGEDLFVLVSRYATKPKGEIPFEAHQDYIDIQVILDGQEIIGYANTDELEVITPYEPDIMELADPEVFTELKVLKGMFAVFFPGDAHKPCCDLDDRSQVFKLVFKVRV